ncbi:anti-sigma regulatory factor (Ser/Thr protein kinase)/anti-anti-sigma regulatory factor [Actinoplanes lutulentus]|uniref:Histidine kinase-like protein n=1 Tax=Actinoplanes lutulentus TaxID=1287878 RepID=A0A327ZJV6_9ACTN|nr:ATP-binding protein [Actinoplanes lutulentus]MBB2944067.1 anti-sigma regulatory factor (Ser/Thr protein kinase)/anti-anti-sigma regulatory factor [Actinoplanes lutulentus]RAK42700.1 histidine kinase-like protein [Actinoplanes lutulentus]
MTVQCEVRADGARLVVSTSGRLQLADVVPLRDRLLKCLAEQPDALLIDLAGLEVDQPPALDAFTVVLRQAARWPGTPVLLCSPAGNTRQHLLQLPLFDDLAAAYAHLGDDHRAIPLISEDLLPVSGATRHARDVATEACLLWELPDLVAPASLIVTELVANVIDHAHTMMSLRISLRSKHLHLAVRDGTPRPPEPGGPDEPASAAGRGLLLVSSVADTWGWLPSEGGKVVWASLLRP